jgi:hypothetical protein
MEEQNVKIYELVIRSFNYKNVDWIAYGYLNLKYFILHYDLKYFYIIKTPIEIRI